MFNNLKPKVKTPDLLIKGEELDQFNKLLGEFPHKYAKPLDQFFLLVRQRRSTELESSNEQDQTKQKESGA